MRCGAKNMGDGTTASRATRYLLDKGANYYLRDLWMDMMPLHYAAFYDVPEVIEILLAHQTPIGEN